MFKKFIQNKHDNNINVIIIAEENQDDLEGLTSFARSVKYACQRRGFSFLPIITNEYSYISESDLQNKNIIIRNKKTKQTIEIENKNIVLVKDNNENKINQSIIEYLKYKNVPFVNHQFPIVESLMDHVSDKKNWKKEAFEIGYEEMVEVPEIGERFVAKADTGNGMYNVLNAEEIKIIDDIVSFKTNGKKIVKKLLGMVDVNVGGIRDFVEKRPLVKFDIKIGDKLKKDVIFTLDDRPEPLAPILLSREFLANIGVTVNPKLRFALGEDVKFKEFRKMFF